jgi:hypothetical protein
MSFSVLSILKACPSGSRLQVQKWVLYNFGFKGFCQGGQLMLQSQPGSILVSLTQGLGSGAKSRRFKPDQVDIGKLQHNFCIVNYA